MCDKELGGRGKNGRGGVTKSWKEAEKNERGGVTKIWEEEERMGEKV